MVYDTLLLGKPYNIATAIFPRLSAVVSQNILKANVIQKVQACCRETPEN
jgi:hypothetical protein